MQFLEIERRKILRKAVKDKVFELRPKPVINETLTFTGLSLSTTTNNWTYTDGRLGIEQTGGEGHGAESSHRY